MVPTKITSLISFENLHHVHLDIPELRLHGVQIPRDKLAAIERNASIPRDFSRVIPKPIVVVARINGQPVRALIDSGSLGDFMSTLQLAVQGSRSKVNTGTKVQFQYQQIKEERYFDIINISSILPQF